MIYFDRNVTDKTDRQTDRLTMIHVTVPADLTRGVTYAIKCVSLFKCERSNFRRNKTYS